MMFEPTDKPRIFGLPPGVDFADSLTKGVMERLQGMPPEEVAKVEIFLNTRRMQRRMREVFDNGPAGLLPRLRLVTDLARDPVAIDVPPPVASLRRRLELAPLVGALLDSQPDLAPRSALYALSDSLAKLMDEMHGEGVDPQAVLDLDVTDRSGHWARTQEFIGIVLKYFDFAQEPPDVEARQRMVIERLIARWSDAPPTHPIIIAGSTGSRGATAMLMEAVSRLPQGAVILPGVDYDMPPAIWDAMTDRRRFEDHPQYRFKLLMERLDLSISDIRPWDTTEPFSPARNRVISLSLRPAPVTDQWLKDGKELGDLPSAMENVTLVEAPSPRSEAETIALRLRAAMDEGITAALITPDRMLTRQVAAALDRWNVVPDDSAGQPLHLSAPGRLLRQVAGLRVDQITGESLLALLKHPLVSSGGNRGDHVRLTNELELSIRKKGPAYPKGADLRGWAEKDAQKDWAEWIGGLLDQIHSGPKPDDDLPLPDHVAQHLALTEAFAAGPMAGESGLWDEAAGRKAKAVMTDLALHAEHGGALSARDYSGIVGSILSGAEVRNPDISHPNLLFWGTLEARVQSADLVILGGMNDGTWPETPTPDPWLNRDMRLKSGLLLPERRIGLSAHDYQQAIAAKEVWITRAARSEEAQTVPSRWVNRLTNLLDGLADQSGPEALKAMRERGSKWIKTAEAISAADKPRGTPAPRPSPCPPVEARPKELSVTQVQTLIRDPYAIYAKKVLGLYALNPLVPTADAPLRGNIIHDVLQKFISEDHDPATPAARDRLMQLTKDELDAQCPWPATRRLWYARMDSAADWFLSTEIDRRKRGAPAKLEAWGEITLPDLDFKLKGKADRIDKTDDGRVILYDYKTGTPPSEKQQLYFDKQLILEAAMVALGAFNDIGRKEALDAEFIPIKAGAKPVRAPILTDASPKKRKDAIEDLSVDDEWTKFQLLIKAWTDPARGYTAMMAAETSAYGSDYDHLARYGEWNLSQAPKAEVLK